MLFMVIERTKNVRAVGERFQHRGRMLPDGLAYQASWMEPSGARCFQVMEADDPALVEAWADRWRDLVEFEIVPVLTSQQFWGGLDATPRA